VHETPIDDDVVWKILKRAGFSSIRHPVFATDP
jgi:hypothetical protein